MFLVENGTVYELNANDITEFLETHVVNSDFSKLVEYSNTLVDEVINHLVTISQSEEELQMRLSRKIQTGEVFESRINMMKSLWGLVKNSGVDITEYIINIPVGDLDTYAHGRGSGFNLDTHKPIFCHSCDEKAGEILDSIDKERGENLDTLPHNSPAVEALMEQIWSAVGDQEDSDDKDMVIVVNDAGEVRKITLDEFESQYGSDVLQDARQKMMLEQLDVDNIKPN